MEARARAYVEGLLARGRHTFTRREAEAALDSSPVATYHSLRRLQKSGWVAMPRRGFYLIIDPEHRQLGALPPTAWIDDLMRFHDVPYYVGLLSAAAIHGAAHQQPQEFQVVAGAVLRPLTVGRVRLRFFFRRRMDVAVSEQVKTSSGYVPVSTPEMTAYDLVRYRKGAGSVDHIATVLAELAERLDARKLLAIAKKGEELPVVQRLGYLLERTGHAELGGELAKLVRASKPKMVPLEPSSAEEVSTRDAKWHLLVNTTVEVEA
ncbi:MAG: type IV toxin-antitoxin system AbiEi family antitoxin [Deltaproteobacteria bacterium]|nr:type IV toxin-antitoxin system AbiEi family antitoxin [Deltaproteobacteria bacterium]